MVGSNSTFNNMKFMKKINAGALFPLATLIILTYALSTQLYGLLPPLGKILNPFTGVVQNGNDTEIEAERLQFKGLNVTDSVRVYFDKRKVPHIYAGNDHDLYFTQGYVTASLRLWQMDFTSYYAAGRISELLNTPNHVDYDRTQRRIGILEAAKASLKLIEKDPVTNSALSAYTEGVNAYIKGLNEKNLPLEYKIFDYKPEPWTKLKSVLILKSLGNTLSGYEEDLYLSKMMLALGEKDFNKLYPDFDSHITPIVNDHKPDVNDQLAWIKKPNYLDYKFITANSIIQATPYNPKLGSNSWVVGGKRTKTGYPILANDPHLNLLMPSFWVEMQLVAPGLNVYGVAIPGSPAIIIGFNKNIAWGITNGADDVKDWYKLQLKDGYKHYKLDDKWLNTNFRVEEIKRRSSASFFDTVYTTKQGPIVSTEDFISNNQPALKNFALRWTLHDPSNEFLTFLKLNKAKDYQEYKSAINGFSCPILNFTFAGKDNVIAITHEGKMPIKPHGEGKFLLDGTRSDNIPMSFIPFDSVPQAVNPPEGYLLSANQHPTYSDYSYYYNGYFSESRAFRIKELLEKEKVVDIDFNKKMQLDNVNSFTEQFLPVILSHIDRSNMEKQQKSILTELSRWKGNYDANEKNAVFYESWLKNIKNNTWDELKLLSVGDKVPSDYVLLDLINKSPSDKIFDKLETTKIETANDIITESFLQSFSELESVTKKKDNWGDINKVNIKHMTDLEAFSVMQIPMSGNAGAINAVSSNWGPSWRMIVQLGNIPEAYGIYPGGQSGNIGSKYYENFVADWKNGRYYRLQYFVSEMEARRQSTATWLFN